MYQSLTASDYKNHLGMTPDYKVDGILVAGTWSVDREFERVEKIFRQIHPELKVSDINYPFLSVGKEYLVGDKRYWVFIMYGGAMLSEFLHLGCLFGSQKNILVGICGGLKKGIKPADIILPTQSFKDGSTSKMYVRDNNDLAESDIELTQAIKSNLDNKHKIWEGKTMTCQAMMGETMQDVVGWSEEGYLGVEMEAATVFSVSKHFNVPAAAVLSVADNLIEEESMMSETYVDSADVRSMVRDDQYIAAIKTLIS